MFLEKSWFYFLAAIVLGLAAPGLSAAIEPFLTLCLMVMMTFSMKEIKVHEIFQDKGKSALLFILNYILLSGLILALAWLFIRTPEHYAGLVVMAAVPCAIAVIPYSKLLGGNVRLATSGLMLNYIASILLTPAVIWAFFSQSITIAELLKTVFLLAVLPFFLSRLIHKRKLEKFDRPVINILFFIAIYGFVGINQPEITRNFFSFGPLLFVLLLRTIAVSSIIFLVFSKSGKRYAVTASLFAGYKNLGYAALLALSLFGKDAALPSILGIIFETLQFIWLEHFLVKPVS